MPLDRRRAVASKRMARVGPDPPKRANVLYRNLFERSDPQATLATLADGVRTVTEHVAELLVDVDALAASNRAARAQFLLTTAHEELGKAHVLLDLARLDRRHEGIARKLCGAFYDHVVKYAYMKAWHFGGPSTAMAALPDYGLRLGRVFHTTLQEFWPGDPDGGWPGDSDGGEPDTPHEMAFGREMNLYVDYSDVAGGWISPSAEHPSKRAAAILEQIKWRGPTAAKQHLRAFAALREDGAFEPPAMRALNDVWAPTLVTGNTDVAGLVSETVARVAKVSHYPADEIASSPLCFRPCYDVLVCPDRYTASAMPWAARRS